MRNAKFSPTEPGICLILLIRSPSLPPLSGHLRATFRSLIDFGQATEAVVAACLRQRQFDCILIGAGIRAVPSKFISFEKLINVVHEHAPPSKIGFNTKPTDSMEAFQRWV